ncbi:ubiquinone biosynthesis protein [Desulfonatronum thiosulfatophilum]|uniref:Ubiquinone biosynthesis protein n=2 Tax=Desulfonatronum thiosulfatophilum TaxID=617002 RepID=A0A1G6DPV3_9BACT|nr:ubiquinone biosynthesis protein [Desulfonatronum thiosulfatophilum]
MSMNHSLHAGRLTATSRFAVIAGKLIKYGFGSLLAQLGVSRFPWNCRRACTLSKDMTPSARLRRVIEELGPAPVKIGQLLSMRPDLIPLELCDELKGLQEDVRRERFEDVRAVVEEAYGTALENLFIEFEAEPVAAASLSQVHRARRKDTGALVAVKVQRPGIRKILAADLEIMAFLAGLANERIISLRTARLPDIVAEVHKSILRELDFTNEARSMLLFNQIFAEEPRVFAPDVHPDLARESVLVMSFVQGRRLDMFHGDPETRRDLALLGLNATVRQMLEYGFFHADPHLGNLKIVDEDKICFFDFGMCGRLTPDMRSALVDYIVALAKNDPTRVAQVAMDMAVSVPPLMDEQRFEADVMFILEGMHVPLGEVNLGRFLLDLTNLCRDYGIFLRSDYILMARALLSIEAAGRVVDPDFDSLEALRPVAARYSLRRMVPGLSDKTLLDNLEQRMDELVNLPRRITKLLDTAVAGKLSVELHQSDFGHFPDQLRLIGNRLGGALITAALIIGSTLVYISDVGPHWNGVPALGVAGFSVSGLLGVFLAWKMFRGT